ncbi:hypothetical protein AB6D60_25785 [Vibrio splendidus]
MKFDSLKNLVIGLTNKYSYLSIFFAFLHQISIAVSVYASVKIIYASSTSGYSSEEFKFWATTYVLCMILPYCLSYFSDIYKEKWLCDSLSNFWDSSSKKYKLCTSRIKKDKVLGVFVTQGKEAIVEFVNYSFYSISSLLNFGLSLFVISLALDYRFFISVLLSAVLVLIINRFVSGSMESLSKDRVEKGSTLTNQLSNIHDNYHNGSVINSDSFESEKDSKSEFYLKSRLREARYKYRVMLLTSFCSLIPTTFLVLFLLFSPEVDDLIKLGIVINLTRVYHLLNSANDLISIYVSLPNIKGQLKVICFFSDEDESSNNTQTNIYILDENDRVISNENLAEKENGLFSIKGRNGSGKTTYLLGYQSSIDGLYFNPAYRLSWPECEDRDRLSDGQYSKACLEWLLSKTDKTLLLDEWDAFLDQQNKAEMSELIFNESKKRKILQVKQ